MKGFYLSAIFLGITTTMICSQPISEVPFVASADNTTYELTHDLTLEAGQSQPAILIDQKSGVTIDFKGFTITLQDTEAQTGVKIVDSIATTVTSSMGQGTIKTEGPRPSTQAFGICTAVANANGFEGLTVSNMLFEGLACGITGGHKKADQCARNKDLIVDSCAFDMKDVPTACGISFGALNLEGGGAHIIRSRFLGGAHGLLLFNNVLGVACKECIFKDTRECSIVVQAVDCPDKGFFFKKQSANIEFKDVACREARQAYSFLGAKHIRMIDTTTLGAPDTVVSLVAASPVCGGKKVGPRGEGLLIASSKFIASEGQTAHCMFGGIEPCSDFRGVTVKGGSQFINQFKNKLFWGIVAPQLELGTISQSVFSAHGFARDACGCPLKSKKGCQLSSAHIQLGLPLDGKHKESYVSDVSISEILFTGENQVGIRSQTGCHPKQNAYITVHKVFGTALEIGVEFINTKESSISHSQIKDVHGTEYATGVGIYVRGEVPCCEKVRSSGITIGPKNLVKNNEIGIAFDCDREYNVVRGNALIDNTVCPLLSAGQTFEKNNVIKGPKGPCVLCETLCKKEACQKKCIGEEIDLHHVFKGVTYPKK